jgi:hypothetical protein
MTTLRGGFATSAGVRSAPFAIARAFIRLIAGSILIAGSVLSAGSASAQTDSAAARALFGEGRDLMEAERFEEACPKFEESLRLDHGMGTQFNLAHCWEKLGRSASAWALFLDVAAAARAGNQPQREAAARERAKAIEPKLTRLRIAVPEPAADMKISRDGQDVGRAAWGTAMPVDPGDHVIRVTAPGKEPWSQDIKIPATSRTFSVTVPALADAAPVKEAGANTETEPANDVVRTDTRPPADNSNSNGQKLAALVVGGVGVAALATGTVFAIQSRNSNKEALGLCLIPSEDGDTCPTVPEQTRHDQLVEDAKDERLIGFIGFGVGGAALITAVILYVTASPDAGSAQAALSVTPILDQGRWGAALGGRF